MDTAPCRLLGEIRYPDEYSFERVGEIETEAGEMLEAALAGLAVTHMEVTPGPESFRFEVWCEDCVPEEASCVCEALLPLIDDGPLGRLVVVRGVEEAISVYYFAGENIDEVTLERP
jgi:hypothetical protein